MKAGAVALTVSSVVLLAAVQAQTPPVAQTASAIDLSACAAVADATRRLNCYDQLSTHAAGKAVPNATSKSGSEAGTPAAAKVIPAPDPTPQFGLYRAEHPAAPPPAHQSMSAKVTALGVDSGGHPTMTLEGDQVWKLDEPDPLLEPGQTVTIKRASLGSFLMTTSARRTHRVQRLH